MIWANFKRHCCLGKKMPNNYMQFALSVAEKSGGDIPVGCVIVKDGEVLAQAANERERQNDPSAHAEIVALRAAAKALKNWRLDECELYVTLEPCPMCAWAILNARIKRVYFGAYDEKYGAFGSALALQSLQGSKIELYGGIMEDECKALLQEYFKGLRK